MQYTFSKIINYETNTGALPNNSSLQVTINNTNIMNSIFNKLLPGDILLIPNNTYYVMGGITASNLNSITIQIDGTLIYSKDINSWPKNNGDPVNCMSLLNIKNVTIRSSGKGIINGNGRNWWGIPLIGYLIRAEKRPKLLYINDASNLIIENIIFTNSPYWTVDIENVNGLIIRHSSVINRRTNLDMHDLIDKSAFNTDGFDISGKNVHMHDCYIWTQDDCIAIKGSSSNMLFERINASGLGLTIGSIGSDIVNNITFRNCYMHKTVKGIYLKFNYGAADFPGGLITNILYENIIMESPSQYAIWIGPAHQSDTRKLCYANPCSLCWPMLKPFAKCNIPLYGNFSNITLRNIIINTPVDIPGVLLGPTNNPMKNIIFDNVAFNHTNKNYICSGVNGIAIGNTTPIPPNFYE